MGVLHRHSTGRSGGPCSGLSGAHGRAVSLGSLSERHGLGGVWVSTVSALEEKRDNGEAHFGLWSLSAHFLTSTPEHKQRQPQTTRQVAKTPDSAVTHSAELGALSVRCPAPTAPTPTAPGAVSLLLRSRS